MCKGSSIYIIGGNPLATSTHTRDTNYRYTQPGTDGLYFASSQHVVDAEIGFYGQNPYSDSRTTYVYDNVVLSGMLDVTNPQVREHLGIGLSDLVGDGYDVTHRVGEYASAGGYTGIIAPSARGDGGVNIVIFHPEDIGFGPYTTNHDRGGS